MKQRLNILGFADGKNDERGVVTYNKTRAKIKGLFEGLVV
jgi:hypothetical protein